MLYSGLHILTRTIWRSVLQPRNYRTSINSSQESKLEAEPRREREAKTNYMKWRGLYTWPLAIALVDGHNNANAMSCTPVVFSDSQVRVIHTLSIHTEYAVRTSYTGTDTGPPLRGVQSLQSLLAHRVIMSGLARYQKTQLTWFSLAWGVMCGVLCNRDLIATSYSIPQLDINVG